MFFLHKCHVFSFTYTLVYELFCINIRASDIEEMKKPQGGNSISQYKKTSPGVRGKSEREKSERGKGEKIVYQAVALVVLVKLFGSFPSPSDGLSPASH